MPSVTTAENAEECEKIEACEMGPFAYIAEIAGYVVRKLTLAKRKETQPENPELQGLLSSLHSEQECNCFIEARSRGGLVNPSPYKNFERGFRREVKCKKVLRNIPVDVICYETITTPIVKSLCNNVVVSSGVNPLSDTQKVCLENIVKLFLKVRSFSYARDYITQY